MQESLKRSEFRNQVNPVSNKTLYTKNTIQLIQIYKLLIIVNFVIYCTFCGPEFMLINKLLYNTKVHVTLRNIVMIIKTIVLV